MTTFTLSENFEETHVNVTYRIGGESNSHLVNRRKYMWKYQEMEGMDYTQNTKE